MKQRLEIENSESQTYQFRSQSKALPVRNKELDDDLRLTSGSYTIASCM